MVELSHGYPTLKSALHAQYFAMVTQLCLSPSAACTSPQLGRTKNAELPLVFLPLVCLLTDRIQRLLGCIVKSQKGKGMYHV